MTAAMLCDGCGRISTTRSAEGEDVSGWWMVSQDPAPDGGVSYASLAMTVDADEFGDPLGTLASESTEHTWEPPRHFCSAPCLADWAARFVADETPEGV